MSHALPAPLYDLDTKRILATAATIAVHVLALMLLLAPMERAPPAAVLVTPVVPNWQPVKPLPPPPPPPPIEITPPRPVTQAPPVQAPVVEAPPVIHDTPGAMDIPYEPLEQPPQDFGDPPSGPIALTVINSPPPVYPAREIRMGVTGKVVLLIEVDATGRAVSGTIEQSSGSKALDQAALKVVLAKWRFVPAQHAGQPITSTARVPIVFSLD